MKNKKIWLIIGSIYFLAVIIFVIFAVTHESDPNTKLTHLKNELQPKQKLESKQEKKTQKDNQLQKQKEAEKQGQADQQVREAFESALQKTADFFSQKKTNFVAIGDSLTQGVGDVTNQGGYVGLLDDTINQDKKLATFENYGKRGNRTDQLIKRLDEDEIAESVKKADVILITIGANDIMEVLKENITNITMSVFAEERVHYEDRLHVLFDKLRILNKNAKIYLVGFYNPFEQYFQDIDELDEIVDRWNATSRKVVATYDDITFIPTKDLFHNKSNLFASDNFHPNIYGYELIAKRVLTYITQ